MALAKIAIDNLETAWRLIPKLHQLTHMVFQHAPQANPRTTHCYGDEDLARGAAPLARDSMCKHIGAGLSNAAHASESATLQHILLRLAA